MLHLKANAITTYDFGYEAATINVVNHSNYSVNVSTDNGDGYTISPRLSHNVDFETAISSKVYLECDHDADVEIIVLSKFKPIFRDTLTPNVEYVADFQETAKEATIINLSSAYPLYFSLDCNATVNGPQTEKVKANTGCTIHEAVRAIHIISDKACEFQVKGERK